MFVAMTPRMPFLAAIVALAAGCGNRSESAVKEQPVGSAGSAGSSAPVPAGSGSGSSKAPSPGDLDTSKTGSGGKPVIHGEKWADTEKGGQAFKSFKESWVYVDGVPKGVLLYPEIPVGLPPAWKDDVEGLDFVLGKPGPREKKIQILRYRVSDYLTAIGIDIKKIKYVYIHGKGMIAIPGDQFRKFKDGITFNWTGNDLSKTKFWWPTNMKTNTSYDRYVALSIFIDKPPLKLDRHNNPYIGDEQVIGIPYFGTPLRGGFRVYVDNKLAMIIKRNELSAVGRTNLDKPKDPPRWNLLKLLEAQGVKVQPVAGDLVVSKDMTTQKRTRLAEDYVANLDFGQETESSGGLVLGKNNMPGTALHLYTKGHVPKDEPLLPLERDWQPKK